MDAAFTEPDLAAGLDVAGHLQRVPRDAIVKGLFLQGAIHTATRARGNPPPVAHVSKFASYPAQEAADIIARCASHGFPKLPPREALRRVGLDAYPTLLESSAGKVLVALTGLDWSMAVDLLPKAYALAGSARVRTVSREAGRAIIELRSLWTFVDCYHVGVFQGGMKAFGVQGTVAVRPIGPADADFELRWQ
ncbi:MAG: DUF2378 family protein [Polyangiaceae bacterium]